MSKYPTVKRIVMAKMKYFWNHSLIYSERKAKTFDLNCYKHSMFGYMYLKKKLELLAKSFKCSTMLVF